MKVVIICSGDGTRLIPITKFTHKGLIKVGGLTITERVILTFKRAGFSDFLLVVGYFKDKIIDFFKDGSRYGVKINYVFNNEWDKKRNGYSVYLARNYIKDNFILSMCDHVFDERIIQAFAKEKLEKNDLLKLVVDTKKKWRDDDTKVYFNGDKIIDIGKKIEKANAVDSGIFLFNPKIFSYFEKNIKKGKEEISSTVREVAKEGKAKIWDFQKYFFSKNENVLIHLRQKKELWWVDVDNFEDIELFKKKLKIMISKDPSDILAKYIHNPIENSIAFYLADFPITAWHITVVINIIAWFVTYLFFIGKFSIGLILAFFVGLIDGVDGKLARLKFQDSNKGKLEHILDYLFEMSWLAAIGSYFNQLLFALMSISFIGGYRMIYDLYSKVKNKSLDMVNYFSKNFRRIAGRRNVYNLLLLFLFFINKISWFLLIVLIWSIITFFVYFILAYKNLDES